MGGILVGALAAERKAHQIQDLIIVVLPVCPVQAQSRRGFDGDASENSGIGLTGLTSGSEWSGLEPFATFERMGETRSSSPGALEVCPSHLAKVAKVRGVSLLNVQIESHRHSTQISDVIVVRVMAFMVMHQPESLTGR
ncbi:hypothetical protein ACYZT4_24870 [Pseudomonas sp. GB2N2]